MSNYKVVSSDNDIYEPPELWTTRVEPRFRERCPRIVDVEGGQAWMVDGRLAQAIVQGTQPGVRFEDPDKLKAVEYFDSVLPGGYIPEEAVKDMDIDGVDVGIVYPTVGLSLYYCVPDSELLTALCSAYNDFAAEFCSANPKRLKGITMLNVDDVQVGVKELERSARLGFAGAMITIYPEERRYSSPEYEPLWATAQDLGMPLGLHLDTNRPAPGQPFGFDVNELMHPLTQINVDHYVRVSLTDMIFSGIFERYPKLQVGSVEMELSWVPHFLDRMDDSYEYRQFGPYRREHRFKDDTMVPSDFFHRNVFVGFQEDALGLRLRDIIGVDNLQWGNDYPHTESTFPKSREILEKILVDCTEEEKAKIAGGNAARVYHLD